MANYHKVWKFVRISCTFQNNQGKQFDVLNTSNRSLWEDANANYMNFNTSGFDQKRRPIITLCHRITKLFLSISPTSYSCKLLKGFRIAKSFQMTISQLFLYTDKFSFWLAKSLFLYFLTFFLPRIIYFCFICLLNLTAIFLIFLLSKTSIFLSLEKYDIIFSLFFEISN